jgi:hypothetical protein
MAEDARGLLERFAPCLRYDGLEAYFADSAEEWTTNPESCLRRADRHAEPEPGPLPLATLGPSYADGSKASPDDVVESVKDDYTRQYGTLREAHQEFRNVIYGRVVQHDGEDWLQYWFFYFLNDYQLAWGVDVHEGDWEMIQLRLEPGDRESRSVAEAVYAQHTFFEARAWQEVRKLSDEKTDAGLTPDPQDGDRPLVFVGRGSHASFFEPGFHQTDFYDVTDGRQQAKTETRLVDVTESPPWLEWPGHWGGKRTGYPGPSAPCVHPQWSAPPALMKGDPPPHEVTHRADAPRLAVRRKRGHLAVDFDARALPHPLKRLIMTVNSADEARVPPRPYRFAISEVEAGSLETRIEMETGKHYDVRVAVVDAEGHPSFAQVFLLSPPHPLRDLRRRISGFAGRLVFAVRQALGSEYAERASGQREP